MKATCPEPILSPLLMVMPSNLSGICLVGISQNSCPIIPLGFQMLLNKLSTQMPV